MSTAVSSTATPAPIITPSTCGTNGTGCALHTRPAEPSPGARTSPVSSHSATSVPETVAVAPGLGVPI